MPFRNRTRPWCMDVPCCNFWFCRAKDSEQEPTAALITVALGLDGGECRRGTRGFSLIFAGEDRAAWSCQETLCCYTEDTHTPKIHVLICTKIETEVFVHLLLFFANSFSPWLLLHWIKKGQNKEMGKYFSKNVSTF